ncbi:unnamed protein product [Gongylonema pulchrum]|uniref:Uncharacterized protein n=1 Tax=Gongylonema pulchrum TaxID=637853 RepID=A0A183EPS7_9BILA|nr:unnamed protein product [Gongylonema pulchrum]
MASATASKVVPEGDLMVLATGEMLARCSLQNDATHASTACKPQLFLLTRRNGLANLFENIDEQTVQELAALHPTYCNH